MYSTVDRLTYYEDGDFEHQYRGFCNFVDIYTKVNSIKLDDMDGLLKYFKYVYAGVGVSYLKILTDWLNR